MFFPNGFLPFQVIALAADGSLFEWGDRSWLEPHRVLPPQVDDEEMGEDGKGSGGVYQFFNRFFIWIFLIRFLRIFRYSMISI